MQNFGGALGVFIIIVVTLAQLAGKNKRAGKNPPKQKRDITKPTGGNSSGMWNKMTKKSKDAKIDSAEKISAEDTTPSFEVDGKHHDNVQGFDVK